MKTFAQLMEQIPHMQQNPVDTMRARQNEITKRQFRKHVHGELSSIAKREEQDKENTFK